MKKLILSAALIAGMAAASFGQGTILVSDGDNVNTSSSASSGGLFFINTGSGPQLLTDVNNPNVTFLNLELLGGPNAGSLTSVATVTGDGNVIYFGPGVWVDFNGTEYAVSGVPLNGTATFQIRAWTGNSPTFAGAGPTAYTGVSAVFTGLTGGATPAPTLTGMPATILTHPVPEPGTLALAGLGAAALLIVRRRK